MSSTPPSKSVGTSPSTGQQYVHNTGQETRRLQNATQFGGRGSTSSYGAHGAAVADPNGSLTGYKTGFQDTGRMLFGTIMDGTALANCYRVHPDHGFCAVIASATSHSSNVCLGATEINTYAPGTRVVLMVHDKDNKAVILGSVPDALDVGKRAIHDYISPMSRKRVDDCHKKYLKQPGGGQMVDWSAGKPYDSTMASEWGAISTTGAAITLDDFMFRASINEFCGIYGFYHDSMLRVAGYNMQVWTAGHERDAIMDQAEYNDTQGYSPYPWEAMGIMQPGTQIVQQYEPEAYQCSKQQPYYARWENKHEFQQPFHRTQNYYGYLGQGFRHVVVAPPEGIERWTYQGDKGPKGDPPFDSDVEAKGVRINCAAGPEKDTDHIRKAPYGLTEHNNSLDGRIFIASAKGITLAKRMLLPIPQRIRRPENVKHGDDAKTNYKSAGMFGAGPDHTITGDIKTTNEEYPNLQRAAAIQDLHGYLFNYVGLHPFYWHAKDYKTWEQQNLSEYAQHNQKVPDFDRLKGKMYLKEETPKELKIDHRYKTQKYYETECYVSLLEDGGVAIGDGYGAEIRMTAGCVFISAPGDIWLKSGRDVQSWAGSDIIQKANNNIDISTTNKDVRIKAESNVMVLAGNDSSKRDGGILLESRGKRLDYDFEKCGDDVRFGGIVLRAPNSNVIGLANNIYLRTGGGGIKEGDITLDAAKGAKNIITKSKNIYQFVEKSGKIFQFFGAENNYRKTNMFGENMTLLCGPIGTESHFIAGGGILCRKSILVSDGHIITQAAAKGAIFVAPCDGECEDQINEGIDKISEAISETLPEAGEQIDEQYLTEMWYGEKKAGNDKTISQLEFSFRKDDDYSIPDFMLFEDRWQQLARMSGKEVEMWEEKPVSNKACTETYPFPGKKWLIDEPVFHAQDLSIAEFKDGGFIDKERGEAPDLADVYKKPEFKAPAEPKVINGNYPIIPRQ